LPLPKVGYASIKRFKDPYLQYKIYSLRYKIG
jgi:hypothetical protein